MSKRKRNHKRRNQRRRLEASAKPATFATVAESVLIQAADGESLPSVEIMAYSGGIMHHPTFGPVVINLAGMEIPESVTLLADHNNKLSAVAGSGKPEFRDGKLFIAGTIADSSTGQEVLKLSRAGVQLQASVGIILTAPPKTIRPGQSVTANGRVIQAQDKPFKFYPSSRLREVSIVPNGVDHTTSVSIAASFDIEGAEDMDPKFSEWLQAGGFDVESLSEQQLETLEASWKATKKPVEPTPEAPIVDIKNINAELKANIERANRINRLFAENDRFASLEIEHEGEKVSLQAHAIGEGWSVDKTELEALRASRVQAPAIHSRSHDSDCNQAALEGAVLLASGQSLDNELYASRQAVALNLPKWLRSNVNDDNRQQAMEAAHRYASYSAQDICAEAVRLDGGNAGLRGTEMIQAAFSGSALTGIFTTSVNANLLTAYMQTSDSTMGWTRSADVGDFKTNERHRMTTGPNLSKLARGKTAEHADRSDVQEDYKIARYAKQFQIDEQDIIDDRMNALGDLPQQFGAAAARLRPDLVYAILLANPDLSDSVALFHTASHANYATSSALAAATLKTAISDIEKQRENSVNLNLRATHLIVPSELKHTAAQLVNASEVRQASTSAQVPTLNTLASMENIMPIADSRLSNGVTDPDSGTTYSGSATTWYMASTDGHTIEVGYLRGTGRAPQVRSFQLDRGTYGIGWDVKMDIGAKALDYRGLHRSDA